VGTHSSFRELTSRWESNVSYRSVTGRWLAIDVEPRHLLFLSSSAFLRLLLDDEYLPRLQERSSYLSPCDRCVAERRDTSMHLDQTTLSGSRVIPSAYGLNLTRSIHICYNMLLTLGAVYAYPIMTIRPSSSPETCLHNEQVPNVCLLEQTSHLPSSPCCLTHHLPACKAVKITCAVGQYAPRRITTFASIIILVEHP
jgi:hypothetical protein